MAEPNEINTYRNEVVWNHTAGAIVFNNTTGQESVSIAHRGGASLVFGNQTTSEFHPNNKQAIIQGDSYNTVKGDQYNMTYNGREDRVLGDLIVITGSPSFINGPVASLYLDKQSEIATAQCSPEDGSIGIGNNTGVEIPAGTDTASIILEKEKELIEVARNMGDGGNIQLLSCKHINIQAGTSGVTFDSGIVKPEGRVVNKKYFYNGLGTTPSLGTEAPSTTTPIPPVVVSTSLLGTVNLEQTFIPQYEEINTTSTIPFGDVTINASTRIHMQAGAGGVDIKSAGSMKFGGSGSTTIGGAQINIGAGGVNDTGCVYILSKFTEIKGTSNVNITAPATMIESDDVTITGNTIINGDLVVGKNLVVTGTVTVGVDADVLGNITAGGNLDVTGNMTAGGNLDVTGNISSEGSVDALGAVTAGLDVLAAGVSLRYHIHPVIGGTITSFPNP